MKLKLWFKFEYALGLLYCDNHVKKWVDDYY